VCVSVCVSVCVCVVCVSSMKNRLDGFIVLVTNTRPHIFFLSDFLTVPFPTICVVALLSDFFQLEVQC